MRDQMDAMIWNAGHDQFSEWIDGGVKRLGARFAGASARRVPAQALAAFLAFGLTLMTVGTHAV